MMPLSKVIEQKDSELCTLSYTPPAFEAHLDQDFTEHQWQSAQGAFVLDQTQKEIAGLEEVQRRKIQEQVESEVLKQVGVIQEEAFKKGFELGQEEGRSIAIQKTEEGIQNELEAFGELVMNIQNQFDRLAKLNEARLIELIFKIASRLATKTLETDAQALLEVVRQSVQSTSAQDEMVLEIHPSMVQFFEDLQKNTGREYEFLKALKIEPNAEMTMGGCLIRTQFGQIDAQLETRLHNLWGHLHSVLPQVG